MGLTGKNPKDFTTKTPRHQEQQIPFIGFQAPSSIFLVSWCLGGEELVGWSFNLL
jgi:hypothetical protein